MSKNFAALTDVSELPPEEKVVQTIAYSIATRAIAEMYPHTIDKGLSNYFLSQALEAVSRLYGIRISDCHNIVESLYLMRVEDFHEVDYSMIIPGREGLDIAYRSKDIFHNLVKLLDESSDIRQCFEVTPEPLSLEFLNILAKWQYYELFLDEPLPASMIDNEGHHDRLLFNEFVIGYIVAAAKFTDSIIGDTEGYYSKRAIAELNGFYEIYKRGSVKLDPEQMQMCVDTIADAQFRILDQLDECALSAAVAASEAVLEAESEGRDDVDDSAAKEEAVAAPETDLPLVGADASVPLADSE